MGTVGTGPRDGVGRTLLGAGWQEGSAGMLQLLGLALISECKGKSQCAKAVSEVGVVAVKHLGMASTCPRSAEH